MTEPRWNGLAFDRGLVEVSHLRGGFDTALPQPRQLDPAEALAEPQLEALLAARGFDALLEQALLPVPQQRALLLPLSFRHALEDARDAVHAAIPAAAPATARLLARAERALNEDLALRDLAQMYRSVLVQG